MKTSHQWVVVNHGGTDVQEVVCTFRTYQEACGGTDVQEVVCTFRAYQEACDYIRKTSQYQEGPGGDHLDIMKRLRSGVLTTEY